MAHRGSQGRKREMRQKEREAEKFAQYFLSNCAYTFSTRELDDALMTTQKMHFVNSDADFDALLGSTDDSNSTGDNAMNAFSKMSDAEIQAWIRKALELPSNFGSTDERFRHSNSDRRWSLGRVIRHRDSGLTDLSNAAVLERLLESKPELAETWEIFGANCWAHGWVDHIAFLAIDENGQPTNTANVIKEFFDALADDPIADSEDYSERELDATYENVENHQSRSRLRDDVPEEWTSEMLSYFEANDRGAIENRDDRGGCPDDDEFEAAARALGFWDESEDE